MGWDGVGWQGMGRTHPETPKLYFNATHNQPRGHHKAWSSQLPHPPERITTEDCMEIVTVHFGPMRFHVHGRAAPGVVLWCTYLGT